MLEPEILSLESLSETNSILIPTQLHSFCLFSLTIYSPVQDGDIITVNSYHTLEHETLARGDFPGWQA